METSSSLGSASSSMLQNAVPLAQLTSNFTPLTLRLDRQNYYYWRAQVISTVRAHGFEGFLLGSVPAPPQFVEIPGDSPTSPMIRASNL